MTVIMPETGLVRAEVTDHAVLRYLQPAHGLDVQHFRDHIAALCANGARYGAIAVATENVKFVLVDGRVVTTVEREKFVYPGARVD